MSIPGHCCPHFDMPKLAELGAKAGARITRVDLAADDFSGQFSVHRARCIYNKGGFQGKGKAHGSMPKFTEIKSGRGAESHGKTFYVGDRKNGKMLRVYEKGLKDDPTRPNWVRWEVQFGNKDRELPWSMLSDPASYFLGAYEPFPKLFAGRIQNASPAYIKTEYESKSSQSLEILLKHVRTQYGKTLKVAAQKAHAGGFDLSRVFASIERPGIPRTLIMPTPEAVARLFGDTHGSPILEAIS
jgi:phage replication initiation protein